MSIGLETLTGFAALRWGEALFVLDSCGFVDRVTTNGKALSTKEHELMLLAEFGKHVCPVATILTLLQEWNDRNWQF
jgi:hypothetical protein